ncbi:MAG: glucose-1-phosphate cytidylyltransferase, partial [Bacilli bacterium]
LLSKHKSQGKLGTLSSYNVGQKFGILDVDNNGLVKAFREKSSNDGALINIGYMVLEPKIFDYIKDESTVFEKEPLEKLVILNELTTFKHEGFWQCMDTKRDMDKLNEMWESGEAPWKVW